MTISVTADTIAMLKKIVRDEFPDVKSSHLSEAIASALGHATNGGLVASYRSNAPRFARLDAERFAARLADLGYADIHVPNLDNIAHAVNGHFIETDRPRRPLPPLLRLGWWGQAIAELPDSKPDLRFDSGLFLEQRIHVGETIQSLTLIPVGDNMGVLSEMALFTHGYTTALLRGEARYFVCFDDGVRQTYEASPTVAYCHPSDVLTRFREHAFGLARHDARSLLLTVTRVE